MNPKSKSNSTANPTRSNTKSDANECTGELWVSVIEKAFAKLYAGFGAIEGGFVDEALVDLTGGEGGQDS